MRSATQGGGEASRKAAPRAAPPRATVARSTRPATACGDPLLQGLPPVLGRGTRVLILGSFPGEASLAAGSTTRIRAITSGRSSPQRSTCRSRSSPIARACATLRAHGIGLWDVIVACRRRGSLDGAIRMAEHGEIARARRAAPGLALVCFNGKTAARALPAWREAGYATLVLPSSSPAYTRPFADEARGVAVGRGVPAAPIVTPGSMPIGRSSATRPGGGDARGGDRRLRAPRALVLEAGDVRCAGSRCGRAAAGTGSHRSA